MNLIGILSGALKGALIHLLGSIVSERIFAKVLARLTIAGLERLAESTETKIDDEIIKPIVENLKKEI